MWSREELQKLMQLLHPESPDPVEVMEDKIKSFLDDVELDEEEAYQATFTDNQLAVLIYHCHLEKKEMAKVWTPA